MKLTEQIIQDINRCVLCWLATVSQDGISNVSPKEIFAPYGDDGIIIANIASPQSVRNIRANPKICISMIDILIQKGCQLKGTAQIIEPLSTAYPSMAAILTELTGGLFPFASITYIRIDSYKPIISPRYMLYPDTTEEEQIKSAKKLYGL